jgi:hypothetical protein
LRLGPIAAGLLVATAVTSSPARCQTTQYIVPGALGQEPVDPQQGLQDAIDSARWRWGPVRVEPWLSLGELAWVESDDVPGDLTATAGTGLLGYLPVGSKVVLAAHALPSYTWWRDRVEDRHWGGRAGLGLFAYSDHLRVEVEATHSDLTRSVTAETDDRTRADASSLGARVEVPIGSRFALFARAGRVDHETPDDASAADPFEDLDHEERTLEGGLRWYVGGHLSVWVGAGGTEVEFDPEARDRSSEGSFEVVELLWERSTLSASLEAKLLELEGGTGSELERVDETVGSARLSWRPSRRVGGAVYVLRSLGYTILDPTAATFLDERVGASVDATAGRMAVSFFYETGKNRYDDGAEEDRDSLGASVGIPLGDRLRLSLGGRRTETSRAGGEARTYDEWRASISLGELVGRWF